MSAHGALTRRRIVVAGATMAVIAVACFFVLRDAGGGTAKATTPSPYAAYSVLSSSEPSGLPIVTPAPPGVVAPVPSGPRFRATPPPHFVGDWPEAASIRKLPITASSLLAWVAKGIDGGLCVLSVHKQPIRGLYPVGITCTPASNLGVGVYGQSQTATSNNRVAVGVVPDGVSSVELSLSNGTARKVGVTSNAWALETEAEVQGVHNIEGGN